MAQRDLITKGVTLENLAKKAFNPDSVAYKELIKELIRLDIPILEIGSSSIGKSYSIRQFMEESGVRGEFLFVGTEKSEFIEGIPNLKAVTEGQAKFSYLKPYWFPDKNEIRGRLKNGREQIKNLSNEDSTISSLWDQAKGNYSYLNQLKETLLDFKRTEEEIAKAKKSGSKITGKYVYEDALLYISTLQGYGNFWLILDEIDKVEKQDKDKYAPLLHIVRERELKGWKLSGIREFPEYDIKFVASITKRIERLDAALADETVDVTDTRIIAIANDLQTMEEESPALYRRFVKLVIRRSLYDEKQVKLPAAPDSSTSVGYDYAKEYEMKKKELHDCIVGKEVIATGQAQSKTGVKQKTVTIADQMAEIEEEKTGKPLEEMNLQWTLGFFPEILFPGGDVRSQGGEMFISNKIIEDFNDVKDPYQTLLFKILQDNFDFKYWIPLLECLYDKISIKQATQNKAAGIGAEVDTFFADAGITRANFNSPNVKNVEQMLERYDKKLQFVESKFAESVDIQKRQLRGETIPDKVMAGVSGGTNVIGKEAIVFGNTMIEKSMEGNRPTELTKLLLSAIPFQQVRFISSSPYIPFDSARDMMEIHDNGMVGFVMKVSGKTFNNEAEAREATSNVFSLITPYRPFIVKYGIGAAPEHNEAIVNGDYAKLKPVANDVIKKIIANRPVMIDQTVAGLLGLSKDDLELKKQYFESIANVKMLEKEVYQNLTYEVWPMIKNSNQAEGLSPALAEEVRMYCKKYPNKMKLLAGSLMDTDTKEAILKDFIIKESDVIGVPIDLVNAI